MPNDKNFPPVRVSARFHYGAFRGDRECDTCIFGISLKNLSFQGESFFALLKAIRAEKKFKKVIIVVTDTLNRINFERDGEAPEAALESAKALGHKWRYEDKFTLGEGDIVYSHQEMIDMVFPKDCGIEVTVDTWDQQIAKFTPRAAVPSPEPAESEDAPSSSEPSRQLSANFEDIHAAVQNIYCAANKKNNFAGNVLKAAMKIAGDSDFDAVRAADEQIPFNTRYLLEELALQVCWAIRYGHSVAPYPVAKGGAVMLHVKNAFFALVDEFKLEKNSLYLEEFMMNSTVKISSLSKSSPRHTGSTSPSTHHPGVEAGVTIASKSLSTSPPRRSPLPASPLTKQRHSSQDLSTYLTGSRHRNLPDSSSVDDTILTISREHSSSSGTISSDDDELSQSDSTSPSISPRPHSPVTITVSRSSPEPMSSSPPSISSLPSSPPKIATQSYSPSTTGIAGFFSPTPSDPAEMLAKIDSSMVPWLLHASQTEDPMVASQLLYATVMLRYRLAATTGKHPMITPDDGASSIVQPSSPALQRQ